MWRRRHAHRISYKIAFALASGIQTSALNANRDRTLETPISRPRVAGVALLMPRGCAYLCWTLASTNFNDKLNRVCLAQVRRSTKNADQTCNLESWKLGGPASRRFPGIRASPPGDDCFGPANIV